MLLSFLNPSFFFPFRPYLKVVMVKCFEVRLLDIAEVIKRDTSTIVRQMNLLSVVRREMSCDSPGRYPRFDIVA
jgi:hypothetical protein